jgi:phage gp36-like protein
MSSYCSVTDIQGEIQPSDLIALCDDVGTGQLDANALTVLNQVISNASGYIDGKVANLYGTQLPFNPVPSSVKSMAITITCYRLFRRRETADEKNKFYQDFKEVKSFLDEVNKGEAHIDDVPFRDVPQIVTTGRNSIYGGMYSNYPSTSM